MKKTFFFIVVALLSTFSKKSYANLVCQKKNDIILKIENQQTPYITNKNATSSNVFPHLKATGNQVYCPLTSLPIVTDMEITDPNDSSTESIYIQISIGYNDQQDLLTLTGTHPSIVSYWDSKTGKLKLTAPINGILIPYSEFIAAIKDVIYTNSSKKPTGNRTFSISIDKVNYLPTNQHFYEYFDAPGIPWDLAVVAAEARSYFGIKGYLATILSPDEQQLAAEQLDGEGWIGGSDVEFEGRWKWMTGPEKGLAFFTNLESTPTAGLFISNPRSPGGNYIYANWNRTTKYWYDGLPIYEPNNLRDFDGFDEDYAHITVPGIGIKGTWNDLNNLGSTKAPHKPMGYIVEYGGMPGDPVIQLVTSTSLTIPQITKIIPASKCDMGELILEATANLGEIRWYENETGGVPIASGNLFTTPKLLQTTTYYVENFYNACAKTSERTPITATIYRIPVITTTQSTFTTCGPGDATVSVISSEGETYWYEGATNNSLVGIGTSFTRFFTKNTEYYVEAVNNGCSNGTRVKINVIVYDLPVVEDQEILWCAKNEIILDATLTGISYEWSTGEKTKTIIAKKPGVFTVKIETPKPESCIVTKTITVIENPIPEIIEPIEVNESQIVINLKNPQNYYEYSLNGINYQSSNIFTNVASGYQTAYVREKKSCTEPTTKKFIVIISPEYFTPNNDGYNDVWEVKGLINYPRAEVSVFDRYGKLIIVLNGTKSSWDGMLFSIPLPSDDYWYVLKIDKDSPEVKGHFSLKR